MKNGQQNGRRNGQHNGKVRVAIVGVGNCASSFVQEDYWTCAQAVC